MMTLREQWRLRQSPSSTTTSLPPKIIKESALLFLDAYEYRLSKGQPITESSLEDVKRQLNTSPAFEGSLDIMIRLLDLQDRVKRGEQATNGSTSMNPATLSDTSQDGSSSGQVQSLWRDPPPLKRFDLRPIREECTTRTLSDETPVIRNTTSRVVSLSHVAPARLSRSRTTPPSTKSPQPMMIDNNVDLVVLDSMNHYKNKVSTLVARTVSVDEDDSSIEGEDDDIPLIAPKRNERGHHSRMASF